MLTFALEEWYYKNNIHAKWIKRNGKCIRRYNMEKIMVKLEERKEELNNAVVVESEVVEMSCSGRADGSWR